MTATSYHFKDIVPSPAQNGNQMVPAVSIEESHENRNAFIGVLSLGKILATVTNGSLEQIRPCRNVPRSRSNQGQSGIIWNHWKVTTQSRHAIHIRLQCPQRIES